MYGMGWIRILSSALVGLKMYPFGPQWRGGVLVSSPILKTEYRVPKYSTKPDVRSGIPVWGSENARTSSSMIIEICRTRCFSGYKCCWKKKVLQVQMTSPVRKSRAQKQTSQTWGPGLIGWPTATVYIARLVLVTLLLQHTVHTRMTTAPRRESGGT